MNKAEFNILSQQPELLDKSRLSDMKVLLRDFPYFQGAKILLLKNLHNINHYEFDTFLKQLAVGIPNRKYLYFKLHQAVNLQTNHVGYDDLLTHSEPQKEQTDLTNFVPNSDPHVLEAIPQSELESNVAENENALLSLKDEEPENLSDEPIQSTEIQELSVTDNDPSNKPVGDYFIPNSFLSWLKAEEVSASIPDSTPIIEKNDTKTTIQETTVSPSTRSNVPEFESILDKFIRENPRISRPKAEFYNPANMAKQSVEEDADLATETLASVYLKQGHYKKAIRVYEKLCLLYPDRFTYFADLIQKIKQEHKD